MIYMQQLCKLAQRLDKAVEIQYADESFKYLVSINNVVHKENHLRRNIHGAGFTIEDAAYDFIRKCKCGQLENYMTNKVIDVI